MVILKSFEVQTKALISGYLGTSCQYTGGIHVLALGEVLWKGAQPHAGLCQSSDKARCNAQHSPMSNVRL